MSSSPGSVLELRSGTLANLQRFAESHHLYAILDAYDSPSVPAKVKEIGKDRGVCLFTGDAETKYWGLAPYLVAVDRSLLDWMMQTVWKAPWGVFLLSKIALDGLREHFRRFLMVRLPDGERWYFRFYDPRILNVYLSNCEPLELQQFFGPVRAFAIPNAESEDVSFLYFQPDPPQEENWAKLPDGPPLVRKEHFETLQKAAQGDFETRTMSFLRRTYPERASMLGEGGLRELVQYGSTRAERYQIVGEDERLQFIELMLLLGRNFDQESNCGWAQAILKDPRVPNVRERINLVREGAQRLPAS
jgi:hypothetical protein